MSFRTTMGAVLVLSGTALPAISQTEGASRVAPPQAGAPGGAGRGAPSQPGSPERAGRRARGQQPAGGPRLFVATGPTSAAGLDRLRTAIGKLAGIVKVEARAEFGAVTVTIDGDGSSSQSLLTAAARAAGFVMRPVTPRYYAATGPIGGDDRSRLRAALEQTPGVEQVEIGEHAAGAAVRITGVMGYETLVAGAKAAGYQLRQIGSYVASGPSATSAAAQLRTALTGVAGVEQVEMQTLVGGATLLVYGDVRDSALMAAAKSRGYALWPLSSGAAPSPAPAVALPTLVPEAERRTPPDYDNRVLEEQAVVGGTPPDFTLLAMDGKATISLADYVRKRPVVLLFGSCT